MKIYVPFASYDEQRYGKPWIAVITAWPHDSDAALRWGVYSGSNKGGEAVVEASAGDIIRWGQKILIGKRMQTQSHWGIVAEDGSITECTAGDAKQVWEKQSATRAKDSPIAAVLAAISDEDLILEIRRRGLRTYIKNK